MRFFYRFIAAFFAAAFAVVLAAGCGPAPTSVAPVPLTMNFPPALRPFGPVFSACADMQPGLSLLVNELPGEHIAARPADIYLSWGEAAGVGRTAYLAGEEELVFIINPSNPVSSISAEQLGAVLSGRAATWAPLLQPECAGCPADPPGRPLAGETLQVWSYPPGSESLPALSGIPAGQQIPPFLSHLAPDPEAMRLTVSREYASLGFIPRRWLDGSVKLLEVRGLPEGAGRLPILAYPSDPSSPAGTAFISCLQQVLNP